MRGPYFVTRTACPCCAAGDFQVRYERPFTEPPIRDYLESFYGAQGCVELEYLEGAAYVLCECSACGLLFQRDVPDERLMQRLYEVWIDPQQALLRQRRSYGLAHYAALAQGVMQVVAHLGGKPASLKMLDFGMGWGEWVLMAKAFGCEVYGVELSGARIAHAHANGIPVLAPEEVPDHRFDLIRAEQVFEHLAEPLETLVYLGRALKPGGLIEVGVPDAYDIERRLQRMDWAAPKGTRNALNPVAPLEHINFFRRRSLTRMGSLAGLEEVSIPLLRQYAYTTGWSGVRTAAANLLRPFLRDVLKRYNHVFFRRAAGGVSRERG